MQADTGYVGHLQAGWQRGAVRLQQFDRRVDIGGNGDVFLYRHGRQGEQGGQGDRGKGI
ncbi:hypothetical protein D3C86_1709140 [compost metagenome]